MKHCRGGLFLSATLALLNKKKRDKTVSVVLAAAGDSVRFGRPKPLVTIDGRYLFEYSLSAFLTSHYVKDVVLAVRKDDEALIQSILDRNFSKAPVRICLGGKSRDKSVLNAFLATDKSTDFVAFHDAARPLITTEDIDRVLQDAFLYGAATAATPVVDSLKRAHGCVISQDIDRENLYAVSTPQVFLKDMYEVSRAVCKKDGFSSTDDNAYVTHAGFQVRITSVTNNQKLTYPEDLGLISLQLSSRKGANV